MIENFYDISKIPSHWKCSKLKYILSFSNEISKNSENEKHLSLTQKGIIEKDISKNEGQIAKSYQKFTFIKKGQICMNPMDLITGWVDISPVDGLISPAYYTFILDKNFDTKFVNYFFQSNYYRKTFFTLGKGVASHDNFGRWVLNPEELKNINFYFPNIEKQKMISNYLDEKTEIVEKLILKIQKKIEIIKHQKNLLINQILTKGIDEKIDMKNSGISYINDIPKHWKIGKLKYLSNLITKGTTPSTIGEDFDENGAVRFLKGEDIVDNEISGLGKTFISEQVNEKLKRSQLHKGDLVVVIAGTLGKCAVVDKKILPANTNQAISLIRLKNWVNPHFVKYWFDTYSCKSQITMSAVIAAQPNLSMEDLGNIYIPFINTEEQDLIVQNINEKTYLLNKKLDLETKRLKILVEYRKSIVCSFITGELTI